MALLDFFKKKSSGSMAKDRLKLVLVSDRANCSPEIMEAPLTEERRKEICKDVKKTAEDSKVAIRNIRRDMTDDLKKLEKELNLPEDSVKDTQDKIQKLTDKYVKIIDETSVEKEKEVMTV